jgi:glycerate 2-kinase
MRILIAPDTFKDALPANEVAEAFATGIHQICPDWECVCLPLADGGEGTAAIMTIAMGGELLLMDTYDPLMRPIQAQAGWISSTQTAIIELAQSSGLQKLVSSERNPMRTTTFGTGWLIRQMLERGATQIYLTLGGSATNEMGTGMAAALGYQFFEDGKKILYPTGADLLRINHMDDTNVNPLLKTAKVTVLCDVNNPLFGEEGAAYIYARQKGASEEDVRYLDSGLRNMAAVVKSFTGIDVTELKGGGAAGGSGAGAVALLKGQLTPGIKAILHLTNFKDKVSSADWVVTGEGSIDRQTFTGKVVRGVCEAANAQSKPVIGICGVLKLSVNEYQSLGLSAVFPVSNGAVTLEKAMSDTRENVKRTGASLAAVWKDAGK